MTYRTKGLRCTPQTLMTYSPFRTDRANVSSCSHLTLGIYFTRLLNLAQGLNVGTLCSGIITVVFLVMFLPVLAFLVFTSNVPKPLR